MRNLVHAVFGTLIVATTSALAIADGAESEASIRFTASQMGVPLQGVFGGFVADVKFDPDRPDLGTVQVRVDLRSVNAGGADANDMLRSAGFLDVARYPQASFEASEFHAQGAGQYLARGSLTLKGQTMSLPVVFTTVAGAQGRWFDGSFTISRLLFHVGQGEWADTSTLDDLVQVHFHLLQQLAAR